MRDEGEGPFENFLDVPGWEEHQVMEMNVKELQAQVDYLEERTKEMWEGWPEASIKQLGEQMQEMALEVQALRRNTLYVAEENAKLCKGFTTHEARLVGMETEVAQLKESHEERHVGMEQKMEQVTATLEVRITGIKTEVERATATHEERIRRVEEQMEQMKTKVEGERRTREEDIRALVDMMRREKEKTMGPTPTNVVSPVVIGNPEVEVAIARLATRMETVEGMLTQKQFPIPHPQLENTIAHVKGRMDVVEKVCAEMQRVSNMDHVARMSAMEKANEERFQMLEAAHREMMNAQFGNRIDQLERSKERFQRTTMDEVLKVRSDIQGYVNRAVSEAMARVQEEKDIDLTRLLRRVQTVEESLARSVAKAESRLRTEIHNQASPSRMDSGFQEQMEQLQGRMLQGESVFTKALKETRIELGRLQKDILTLKSRPPQVETHAEFLQQQINELTTQMEQHRLENAQGSIFHEVPKAKVAFKPFPIAKASSSVQSVGPSIQSANLETHAIEPSISVKPNSCVRPELRLAKRVTQPTIGSTVVQSVSFPMINTIRPPTQPASRGTAIRGIETHLAPVQVHHPMQPMMQLLPTQLLESITGRHPGKYTGNAEDWPTWRRKWLPFMREIEGMMPTITDAQRLALLRSALDEAGTLLLDQELEGNPDLGYEEYWARLDLEFGAEDREVIRRKLHRVKLAHAGRVSEKSWREMYAQMTTLALQLGDISDTDLGRLLTNALPSHPWRRKLAQEEDKKTERGALMLDGLPEDVTNGEVEDMIQEETGTRPIHVRRVGKRIKVTPRDEDHRGTIKMVYDRQKLQGGNIIKVSPDTSELGAKEINDLMIRWLRMEQRISNAPERDQIQYDRRQPRWQREVDMDSEESVECDRVNQVGKGSKRQEK